MLSVNSDNKARTIQASDLVKAVAVIPGKPNTIRLRDVPKPRIGNVPGGRGVLVKILRVGVAKKYRDLEDLRLNISAFIERYYNRERLRSALGYRSPAEFEEKGNLCDATSLSNVARITFAP